MFIPDDSLDSGDDDRLNYAFEHDYNNGIREVGNYSNGYAWVCDPDSSHTACLALSNPRLRWKPASHIDNFERSRSIGYDFKYHRAALSGNRLYLTIAMKYGNIYDEQDVATIFMKVIDKALCGWEYIDYSTNWWYYHDIPLTPVNPAVGTTIRRKDYVDQLFDDLSPEQNRLFEYYFDLPEPGTELYNQTMVAIWNGDYFKHICPQVYWHGNVRMELDYIILEDEYHRQIRMNRNDNILFAKLQARLDQISSQPFSDNILFYSAKD